MKFNFKKITSVLASAIMLGSTIGIAAAASYPAPFISGGAADVAVVVGAAAHSSDYLAAVNLGQSLQTELAKQTATGGTGTTGVVSGEAKAIETSGQKLYLGDFMNSTKEAFTKTELPTVLADGKVVDTDGTSFDYSQKIKVPNTEVKYGKTADNLATPILFIDLESSSENYQEEIVFPTAVNVTKLRNKDINLFGKKYTFSGSASDLTTAKIVMYENTQGLAINEGESKDVTVGDVTYTVLVTAVESSTEATVSVNGVSEAVTEGSSYKISGLDIYIKNVMGANVAGSTRAVELYAGSAKLTLESGSDITKGTKTLYGARATITASGGKVSKITIAVTPYSLDDRVRYIKQGGSFTDPVFGTFKIDFATVNPELEATTKNKIVIKSSGEQKGRISFTNKAGKDYDMELFKPSSVSVTSTGVANASNLNQADTTYVYNATQLGFDTYRVIASTTGQVKEDDYFITRNNEYSQIFRVDRIDITNKKIKVRDQATGGDSQEVSLNASHVGSIATLTLIDGSSAILALAGNDTGSATNITVDKASTLLYTKSGASIDLARIADPVTYNQTSSRIVITEETTYNDGDFKKNDATTLGSTINVTMLYNRAGKTGNDIFLNTPTVGDSYSGTVGDYDVYYLSKYGSYVKQTGSDDKTAEIFYSGTATSLGVFIGEIASIVTTGTAGTGTVTELGSVTVKDNEISSVQGKNLIVVGGSCINTVAAKLLGSETPLCGAAFTTATGVGADQFLVKVVASPYTTGKVAMLVAGYEAADTTKAVTYVTKEPNVVTDSGTTLKKVTATYADVTTA